MEVDSFKKWREFPPKADANVTLDDFNPLQLACSVGDDSLVKSLILNGFDVNFQTKARLHLNLC
jgi:hypothetical protein